MEKNFTFSLDKFLGLHEMGDESSEIKAGESPHMENFEITAGYKLKKRPGYRPLLQLPGRVRALWRGKLSGNEYFFAAADTCLYRIEGDTFSEIGQILPDGDVTFVLFGGRLFVGEGNGWQVFDPESGYFEVPTYYRPLLTVATPPTGGGTVLESINLLWGCVAQRFSPDGKATEFCLASKEIFSVDYILRGGQIIPQADYTVSLGDGTVNFKLPPDAGTDDLTIGYSLYKSKENNVDLCPFALPFGADNDTRLVFFGHPGLPDHIWWSGVGVEGEGLYVPADCYNRIGNGDPITAVTRHYDRLLIFTRSGAFYLSGEEKYDEVGNLYTSFPVTTLSNVRGNLMRGAGLLLDNHPFSVGEGGFYRWVSTYQRDERNAEVFSSRVSKTLSNHDLSQGLYFDRESSGQLWCVLGEKILIYDYRLDVFYLFSGFSPTCFFEYDRKLYFGTQDGRMCLYGEGESDGGKDIDAFFESPYLNFGYPHKTKNIHFCDLVLLTDSKSAARFSYLTDKDAAGRSLPVTANGGTFDFSHLDFQDLSFITAVSTLRFSRRIGAKRLNVFKFRLENKDADSTLRVLSVILDGTILLK